MLTVLRCASAAGKSPAVQARPSPLFVAHEALMIEIKNLGMDWGSTEPYLREFASSSCLYQTIVTSWELPRDIAMLGWQIYELPRLTTELGIVNPVLL